MGLSPCPIALGLTGRTQFGRCDQNKMAPNKGRRSIENYFLGEYPRPKRLNNSVKVKSLKVGLAKHRPELCFDLPLKKAGQ